MAFYWQTKIFKTFEEMEKWVQKNSNKYQMRQVFINNSYGIEYKDLVIINI